MEKPGDVLKEGQEVVARVIEVNPGQRRMRLSLSALEAPAVEEQQPGTQATNTAAAPAGAPQQPKKKQQEGKEGRRGGGQRQQREAVLDEDALSYNPFAEAFKGQDFGE